ncbi:restriction endonuclease subunit S [Endozoicomonas ascidiicola]|uniref:restriction endonuclease subunit S n=1 Tax=Endozoicomonas ascidiicola TaxID=1698521 RepID=UPI00082D7F44|nr:restriction endonuclease subunit S [Endozoicomonas ascidiicola]
MILKNLPQGWTTTTIGSVCSKPQQRKPEDDEVFRYIDISSIDRQTKTVKGGAVIIGKDAPSRARKVVDTGDVLVSMTRPNLNAVAMIDDTLSGQIASTGFDVLKPVMVDPRWIFNIVRYNKFIDAISGITQGALYPACKSDDIRNFEIPLPPLKEQKKIVQKLDDLLGQVATIEALLDQLPAIIKQFRQSVLAAAVAGHLTEEWRKSEKTNWEVDSLANVSSHVVDCPHSTPKWTESGKLCVRTNTFNPFHLDLSDPQFVSEETYLSRISRLKPEPGDILYSREGTVGIACQIPLDVELCLGQRMLLIRAGDRIQAKYLTIVLNSDYILSVVRSLIMGSTAPRINMKDIRAFKIPIPTYEEQTEIVKKVDEYFAFADALESNLKNAKAQVDNLSQSILAKAFRGELVDQQEGGESAEVLLQKIAEARAEAELLEKATKKATRARKIAKA